MVTGRLILEDYVDLDHGVTVRVSTVYLGIEYDWKGRGGYYYETMFFFYKKEGSDAVVPDDDVVVRYRTEEEAREGHKRIVEALRSGRGYRFKLVPRLLIDCDELERIVRGDK